MLFILAIFIGLCITYDNWIHFWRKNKWYHFEKYVLQLMYSFVSLFAAFLIGWVMFGLCPSESKRIVKAEISYETTDSVPVFTVHNNISGHTLGTYNDKDKFCSFTTLSGDKYYFDYGTKIELVDSLPANKVKFIQCMTYKKNNFPKNLDKCLFFFSLRDEDGWHASLEDYDNIILQVNKYKIEFESQNDTIKYYDTIRK